MIFQTIICTNYEETFCFGHGKNLHKKVCKTTTVQYNIKIKFCFCFQQIYHAYCYTCSILEKKKWFHTLIIANSYSNTNGMLPEI